MLNTKRVALDDPVRCELSLPKSTADKMNVISKSLYPKSVALNRTTKLMKYICNWFVNLSEADKPDFHPATMECYIPGKIIHDVKSELTLRGHTFDKHGEWIFSNIAQLFMDREYDRIEDLVKMKEAQVKMADAQNVLAKAQAVYDQAEQELYEMQGDPLEVPSVEEVPSIDLIPDERVMEEPKIIVKEKGQITYPVDIQHDETPGDVEIVYHNPDPPPPPPPKKGTYVPVVRPKEDTYWVLEPSGDVVHVLNLRHYCYEKGLNYSTFRTRLKGIIKKTLKGYFPFRYADPLVEKVKAGEHVIPNKSDRKKHYIKKDKKHTFWVLEPSGEIVFVPSLKRYCNENDVSYSTMMVRINGTLKSKTKTGYFPFRFDDPLVNKVKSGEYVVPSPGVRRSGSKLIIQKPDGDIEVAMSIRSWCAENKITRYRITEDINTGKDVDGYIFWDYDNPEIKTVREYLEVGGKI